MRVLLVGAMLAVASAVAAQDLTLKGPTGTTATLSAQQIAALPHVHFTFAAHGESHVFEGPLLSDLLAKVPNRLFIGGDWVESTSGRHIEVKDPATGAVIKTIADASVADAASAMDAAAGTQAEWAATPPRSISTCAARSRARTAASASGSCAALPPCKCERASLYPHALRLERRPAAQRRVVGVRISVSPDREQRQSVLAICC